VATYGAQGGGAAGQVGVVGPMRMDYSRVIPLVEYTAGVLSDSFGGRGRPEPLVPEDDDDAERID
jgi:heat-inducible transcriptional repressor